MTRFFTYILECADGTRYCGLTSDLAERLRSHRAGRVRYTRTRRPVRLAWFRVYATRGEARKQEKALKNGRTRRKAIDLMIASFSRVALDAFDTDKREGTGVKGDSGRHGPNL